MPAEKFAGIFPFRLVNTDLSGSCCGAAASKASPGEKLSSASETEEECGQESNDYCQGNRLSASLRCTPFLFRQKSKIFATFPPGEGILVRTEQRGKSEFTILPS